MKSLDIPIVITPTLTPRQRGRGIFGFPHGHYLENNFLNLLGPL